MGRIPTQGVDRPDDAIRSGTNVWYSLRRSLLRLRKFIPGLSVLHRRESMVGPLGHWESLRRYQLRALRECGLLPHHRVLDLGCGPLQGGIAMIEYLDPTCYVGVDIEPSKLAEGYAQIAERRLAAKNPRLLLSERFGAEHLEGESFDVIWASQILYYFNDATLRDLLRFVAVHLRPGGRLLGDILGECDPPFRSSRHLAWMRSTCPQSIESMRGIAATEGLAVRSVGRLDAYGYPSQLNLRSSLLLEFRRAGEGADSPGMAPELESCSGKG